jgi:hypothetical protein
VCFLSRWKKDESAGMAQGSEKRTREQTTFVRGARAKNIGGKKYFLQKTKKPRAFVCARLS